MRLGSVAVLGGGPGGLYAARLLKLRWPDAHVEVHEQGSPDTTFGFGVGLATRTQRNLQAADPTSLADIVDRAWGHDMSMRVGDDRVRLPLGNLLAIGRSELLAILQRHATDAGVALRFGSRATAADLGRAGADLVVAADGVSSATRDLHAAELGAEVVTDHGHFLWCGTEFALPSAVFTPVTTEAGTFVAHAYPYAADRSTFLVETDDETWQRAGFDRTTESTPFDENDETALGYLAEAFREELQGHPLIGNRTRWTSFRTVTCERWHVGNTVLLGDAAHTAHYSIGSGTKLAMEDAITLVDVLAAEPDLESALTRYEAERRPAVEHLQDTAVRSMRWWHTFPERLDLPVDRLFLSYMTRAGKVSLDRFATTAPDVVARGVTAYAAGSPPPAGADLGEWVLERPFTTETWSAPTRVLADAPAVDVVEEAGAEPVTGRLRLLELPTELDDPWGPAGLAILVEVTKALESDCDGVLLTCRDDGDAVLTMLETAERVKRHTGAVVAVRASARWRDHVVAGLASGRTDLVDLVGDRNEEAA